MNGSAGGINTLRHLERNGESLWEGSSIRPADAFTAKGHRGKGTLLSKGGVMEEGNNIQVSLNLSLEKLPWS